MKTSIARTSVPPTVDGVLDESEWTDAVVVNDLHQFQPGDHVPPTEKSEFFLMYDADALYIGARLSDREPGGIAANVLRQGAGMRWDDRVKITLDPFNNKRSGYEFEVNANGIRGGGLYKGDRVDRNFKGVFQAESKIGEDGWTAEMRIPFQSLSFVGEGDWGLNLVRVISRKQESIGWSSRNRQFGPAQSGTMTGLQSMTQGVGLDVVPSLSARTVRNYLLDQDEFKIEPSLDVFYKITPALNGALTINTDFSATEVDGRQVDLSRFSLFFPEKRAFFLRESDIFEFGDIGGDAMDSTFARPDRENGRPYFSRRIGLSPVGTPVDLDVGAKLSGRVGRWNIGAMALHQGPFEDIDSTDILVTRISANVLKESAMGMVLTKGDPRTNLDNTLFGLDYLYTNTRLPGGRALEAGVWYQTTDTEGTSGETDAYGFSVNSPNRTGWRGSFGAREIQEDFNPALGFVSRPGVRQYLGEVGYTYRPSIPALRSVFGGIDVQRVDEIDGGLQSESLLFRIVEIENNAGDEIKLRHDRKREGLLAPFEISAGVVIPIGEYSFSDTEFSIETGQQRKFDVEASYRTGDFFDGKIDSVSAGFGWRPSKHFRASATYRVDDVKLPQGDFTTKLFTGEFDVAFNNKWAWLNLVQYDNVSESIGISSRLQWVPQAGQNAFLVLNHNYTERLDDGDFHSASSDLTLKFDYTFRY